MGTFEHDERLFDMHCHLGFASDAAAVRLGLSGCEAAALSCTVLPQEYERDVAAFADLANCTIALGLHPWRVTDDIDLPSVLAHFAELASETRFIGEVGLDHAGGRGEPAHRALQQNAFAHVLEACDAPSPFPRKLISLHAVHAATDVLNLLEAHGALAAHDCIFHWFAGSSDELKRAIEAGCFFSVGPRMLATKRGQEYARVIPAHHLLLETDSPSQPGEAWTCTTWTTQLDNALSTVAEIRNVSKAELARTIARTSEGLLRPA